MLPLPRLAPASFLAAAFLALATVGPAAAQAPVRADAPPVLHRTVDADSLYTSRIDPEAIWRYRILEVEGDAEFWVEIEDPYGGRVLTPRFYQQVIEERGREAQEGRGRHVSINLPQPAFYALLGVLAAAVVLLVLLPLYVYRRRYLAELDKRRRLQEAKRQLAVSREDERRQLARELHDGPLQDLHALHMQLGLAAEALSGNGAAPDQSVERRVRGAQDDAHTVVGDLRRITEALRPPALGPFGLAAALEAHAHRFGQRYPAIQVAASLDSDGLKLPEPTRLALFRIAQEAMNNAVKHGSPSHIDLMLDLSDDEVCLAIEDDGPGLAALPDLLALAAEGHFGLLGMQERADSVSGDLQIHNRAEGGLRVHVSVQRTATHTQAALEK